MCKKTMIVGQMFTYLKKTSEGTANGSGRTQIAGPKGAMVSLFGMQHFSRCIALWSKMDTPTLDVSLRVLDPSKKRNAREEYGQTI